MFITVKTNQKTELIDITSKVQEIVLASCMEKQIHNGLCVIYVPHTTAAVTINESADPSVKNDILMILNKIIPWEANYRHLEGNSPAHVKAVLVGASKLVMVENKKLALGTWQGVFFCEFDGPRSRKVNIKIIQDK
ncbi:MAG: secondary thiamine-phosphate synthase enzyme YjbQ [Proteobacteria bacterium]|nr:secondary thiamine-phosphate synthase enzyme YjbQ [Pseudomonadota bacterium]